MKSEEVFWVIPMGHHMSLPIEPWALSIECKPAWTWYARDLRDKLADHIRRQLSLAQDMWCKAIRKGDPGALLSSCDYPQGQFLSIAQEVQHLNSMQDTLGQLEAVFQVENLERKDETVLDYSFRPDDKIQHWMPIYLDTMSITSTVLGKIAETKTEHIPTGEEYPPSGKDFEPFIRELVAPMEIDGWKCRIDKGLNQHRYNQGAHTYEVSFHRYVDPPTWTEADE